MEGPWSELLNSDWHDHLGSGKREDRLENEEWLRDFVSRWAPGMKRTKQGELRSALRELRMLLQRIVGAVVSGDEVHDRDWKALNAALASAPLTRRLVPSADGYEIEFIPERRDLASFVAEIAHSFAEVFAFGDSARIKVCENSDCGWIFYDMSRNRSRRWCEGSECGNLMKVRRFRARQKAKNDSKQGR